LAFADGFQDPTNGVNIPTAPTAATALVAAVRNVLLPEFTPSLVMLFSQYYRPTHA
jgi:hypothetical protein